MATGMFDRFTEGAREVLTLAQEEALRFDHDYLGTEHLLLGLVREGDGVAARILTDLGVSLPKVRSAVDFIIGRGESSIIGEIGLTPRAKKVIELALDEAKRLNHHYIGTEHLLLGIVREGEGIAAGVLESLRVNLEQVRRRVMAVVSQATSSELDPSFAPAIKAPRSTPRPPAVLAEAVPLRPESRSQSAGGGELDAFTDLAQEALSFAAAEAKRFSHNFIGTEHILLGLTRARDGNAATVLDSLGIQMPKVRKAVEFIIGRGRSVVADEAGLTPRAKKCIALAIDESRRMKHDRIGTEHLLIGLVREGEGIAAGVLESLGVNLERVRSRIERGMLLGADGGPGVDAVGETDEEKDGPNPA